MARLQTFEADFTGFRIGYIPFRFSRFDCDTDFNYFIINLLILTIMEKETDFLIVDYSQKALAVFGNTRPIKDQLKALGGRFNPKLTHNEKKQAGWIFSKSKEQELRNLLTVK
jgi:hypothetical protein